MWSSIFVHRFVQFFQQGWNASKLSLPIKIFSAHESFYLCFFLFPVFHYRHPSMGKLFVLSVVDYFRAMSLAAHANSKLRDLNYDKFRIEIVCWISTTIIGDVLFEFSPVTNPSSHYRQMQRMDMKHDGHVRLKQLTSRTISTLLFKELGAWAICNAEMMFAISFFLIKVKTK